MIVIITIENSLMIVAAIYYVIWYIGYCLSCVSTHGGSISDCNLDFNQKCEPVPDSFPVYREAHVRAVYSIYVLAYFLNKDLAERRKKIEGLDYLNSKNLYEPFRNGDMVTLKDRLSGKTIRKPVELNRKQRELLNKMAIKISKLKI